MKADNLVVHGMWIGTHLSPIELLTMQSYLAHGHQFVLWHYDVLTQDLPPGVVRRDASEIIPREQVFNYKHRNQWGHGKGSYAGFSDIFRYKLLHEVGGWWSDMDVTCLRPLDIDTEYAFREHDVLPVVGNVMKAPKGSELMRHCHERAMACVDADNTNWLLPIEILNEGIRQFGLTKYIRRDFSNLDRWDVVVEYGQGMPKFHPDWHVFHWMNEEWRTRGIDKQSCLKRSRLQQLYRQYAVQNVRYLPNRIWLKKLGQSTRNGIGRGIGWLRRPGIPKFLLRK
ncbi:hypothetical protein JI742_10510 [Piscinibacter sp. Jin2]|uniref:Alpha 1,4-glycosyltransferase domain-containing protein n=1 Tax=Aquariibacter lacus TaxID=2801332 RepID=A0A9X1BRU5_9BURK|nr:glycosyltransferase [Piscinibacter lacus]MBL0720319.1 hypothetical protein [Piscinibacter lacus]